MSNRTVPAAAEGMPAFPGFPTAFEKLEDPIRRLARLAETLAVLHEHVFPSCEDTMVLVRETNALTCLGLEIRQAADDLDTMWLSFWNAAPTDIHAARAGRSPAAGAAR